MFLLLAACAEPPGDTTKTTDTDETTAANGAPAEPLIALSPSDPTTTDDLLVTVQGGAADPDGDAVTFTYAWFRDGADAGLSGDSVSADLTAKGEVWRAVVTPSDGQLEGPAAFADVTILNTAPSATLSIDPLSPTAADTVTATAITADVDDDDVTITWSWTRDGVSAGLLEPVLPAGSHSRGQTWAVMAVPSDGEDDGEPATVEFTVANAPPVLGAVTLQPASPTVLDTLGATFTGGADADEDALVVSLEWWVNDVPVATDEVDYADTATLAGAFARGDRVKVRAEPYDGYDHGEIVESAEVVIVDSPPSATGATILPNPLTTADDATCVGSGWSDPDGDTEGWETTWTVNGATVSTSATLAAGSFVRGDSVGCTLVPYDGELGGAPVEAEPVVVANATPTCAAVGVTIGPEPATIATTLSITTDGYVDCTDPDGDTLTRLYEWQVDGVLASTGETLANAFARGDGVQLTTSWTDGYVTAASAVSNTVVIVNEGPVVTSVELSPDLPTTDDTLSVAVTTSDLEGDTLDLEFVWTVDGVEAGTDETLSGDEFARGQVVVVTVTAFDGTDTSDPVAASVTIENTVPAAPVVSISPATVDDDDDLLCTLVSPASDADGDTITYAFTWVGDGVAYASATTTTWTGDTVPASATALGETWTCTVTASDGTDSGLSASASTVIGCDRDGDGYADTACGGDDCDDADAALNPGATELCDAADLDEDCDGLSDDADPSVAGTTWYRDADADSYGTDTNTRVACSRPSGYQAVAGDCDDSRSSVRPNATERCDNADLDEDCDDLADDADPSVTGQVAHYIDADDDGYGDETTSAVTACSGLEGHVTSATDCDDTTAAVSPAAEEVCGDGIDNDCGAVESPCGINGGRDVSDAGYSIEGAATSSAFAVSLAWGDLNGDGAPDIAAGNVGEDRFGLWFGPFGSGTGNEASTESADDVRYSGLDGIAYLLASPGDVDGDGYDDILMETYSFPAYLFLHSGGPNLADTTLATTDALVSLGGWSPIIPAGDFNDDGFADFFLGTSSYSSGTGEYFLDLWLGDTAGPSLATTWGPGTYFVGGSGSGARDWDGDGIDDVVTTLEESYSSGNDGVVFIAGSASPAGTTLDASDLWVSGVQYGGAAAAGDVDDDGYEDAAFIDYGTDQVYIVLGPPATGLTTGDAWATGSGNEVAVGDTDDDGLEELFLGAGYYLRRYEFPLPSGALWDEVGAVSFGSATSDLVSPVAGIDFSGDGAGDLLFAYYGTGLDYVRLFEGGVE